MSFVRKSTAKSVIPINPPGCRSWINEVILTSSGIEALDLLLGGGVPLGSIVLIKEDEITSHYNSFTNYFISEGISHGHSVICVKKAKNEELFHQEMLGALPSNVTHIEKYPVDKSSETVKESDQIDVSGLKIAWQYEKYAKPAANVGASAHAKLCSQYDSSSSIQSLLYNSNRPTWYPSNINSEEFFGLITEFVNKVQSSNIVGRIVVTSCTSWNVAMWLRIRSLINNTNVVICLTCPVLASIPFDELNHIMDIIITLKSSALASSGIVAASKSSAKSKGPDFDGELSLFKRPKHALAGVAVRDRYSYTIKRTRIKIEEITMAPSMQDNARELF